MTPTSGPWNADMVSRHPQSASNMIGKLEADVARLERERDNYRADSFTGQSMHAQWQERAERAEDKLAGIYGWARRRVSCDDDYMRGYENAKIAILTTIDAEDVPA